MLSKMHRNRDPNMETLTSDGKILNLFQGRLEKALGPHLLLDSDIGACVRNKITDYEKMKHNMALSVEARGDAVLQCKDLVAVWVSYCAAQKVIDDFVPSPDKVEIQGPTGWPKGIGEYLQPVGRSLTMYAIMVPSALAPQILRILDCYKKTDLFSVVFADYERWGSVTVMGLKTLSQIVSERITAKIKASCLGNGWSSVQAVKPKKWLVFKATAVNNCAEVTVEGQDLSSITVPFDQFVLNQFCIESRIMDVYLLLGEYSSLAGNPDECIDCNKEVIKYPRDEERRVHTKRHKGHCENAKAFGGVVNKKTACLHAVDALLGVMAKAKQVPRYAQWKNILNNQLTMIYEGGLTRPLVAAAVLLNKMMPMPLKEFAEKVIDPLVQAVPKRQGFIFKGPMNCGKSTVASCLTSLLGGVSLNVNVCPERLWVELGRACHAFVVNFEDVMGIPEHGHQDLAFGLGMHNLNCKRDYLDGLLLVGLERKHCNPIEMHFPPWVATTNQYIIPDALMARTVVIPFDQSVVNFAQFVRDEEVDVRSLASGCTLALALALYCPGDNFDDDLREKVEKLREEAEGCDLAELECELEKTGEQIVVRGDGTLHMSSQELLECPITRWAAPKRPCPPTLGSEDAPVMKMSLLDELALVASGRFENGMTV